MTEKALNKLNERQLAYCKTESYLIVRARERGVKLELERHSGKLRGFLECLCQMGVINGSELKTLYLWFFSEDRTGSEIL